MKILYLVHQFFPQFQAGTEKFVLNTASMAQQNGHKVKIVTYDCGVGADCDMDILEVRAKEYSYHGIPVFAFQYKDEPFGLHYIVDRNLGVNFAKYILEKEKPDMIHVGHLMRVFPIIFAAMEMGIPYVMTLTDFHLLCPKIMLMPTSDSLCSGPEGGEACAKLCGELPTAFIKQRLELTKDVLAHAARVIAPSKFVADLFQHEIPELKILVNNHGLRQNNLIRKEKVYDEDNLTFGFIGNLAVHKGPQHLIRVFSEMNHPTARLLIYGTGETEFVNNLRNMAKDRKIEFRGAFPANTLPEVMREIDVFVNPALWYETYSFVNQEALASEVPVVCSKLGGMYERIVEGKNGFTYSAGDSEELKKILMNLINSPAQLNQMREYIRFKTLIPVIEQEAYRYNHVYNMAVK